ncbi:MAG: FAD-dependent oxidoreductase, partial [Gemmobacter sp.]
YAEQRIDLKLGAPVRAIDPVARRLRIGDADLAYDRLVLATGAIARRLPPAIGGALRGVHCIRSIGDVDAMADAFARARRVLIVGGGYIGLEAAAVAAERGLSVTLVETAPRILQRVAAAETADYFRALHRGRGVDIREGVGLARLHGRECVTAAELTDGTVLAADFV